MWNVITLSLLLPCLVLCQQQQFQQGQPVANQLPQTSQQPTQQQGQAAGQQPQGQPPVQQLPAGQAPVQHLQPGQPEAGQHQAGQPQVGQPQVGQPPVGQPPVGQPPVGQLPVGQPPVGHLPVGQPPVGQLPVGQPPVGQLPVVQPHQQQRLPPGVPSHHAQPHMVEVGVPHGQQHFGDPQMVPQGQAIPNLRHDAAYNPDAAMDDGGSWLESVAPGVSVEYKVHVDAGKEDCYWQYAHTGSTFYMSSQVLKGGDGNVGVAVRQPNGKIVYPYQWKPSAEYEEDGAIGGYYSVCLDNQFSKFSAKLVNLYITTFRYDEWEKFSDELKDMDMSVGNFTETLTSVDRRVQVMKQFQQLSRGLESRDYNLLVANMNYVTNWSLVQCVVVITCSLVQVYFVRRLFASSDHRGKSKARA